MRHLPPARPAMVWAVVSACVMLLGAAVSAGAAVRTAHADTEDSRRRFAVASDDVVSTLRLAIQHENDLVYNAAAVLAANPDTSNAAFVRWVVSVHAMERYPELQGVGMVVIVRPERLAAFVARTVADPPHPLAADGTFQIVPPGVRPYYCFAAVSASRAAEGVPAGFDFCANHVSSMAARDSGLGTFDAFPVGGNLWLGLGMPVYRGGVAPSTVDGRRSAFVGWLGVSLVPTVVLTRALQAHPGMAVLLRHHGAGPDAVFHHGLVPDRAQVRTLDLGGGWSAQTYGLAAAPGLPTNRRALALLLSGIAVSLLLASLLFVLATGRARALRLVAAKTEELRHLATHDALTGLPNRTLILDRVAHAVARAHRYGGTLAVMFLDLDGFKEVNDTYGHPVGDRLLCEVAQRLLDTLRTSDTVGRLGGDEFVVVLEGESLDAGAEIVADRIRAALAEPVHLDGVPKPVRVAVSIGIALGARTSADELLRDADIAVYEAKKAGKDRYALFTDEMRDAVGEAMGGLASPNASPSSEPMAHDRGIN
jgi:diguanylate cyclase (GGDEF)-like protein